MDAIIRPVNCRKTAFPHLLLKEGGQGPVVSNIWSLLIKMQDTWD